MFRTSLGLKPPQKNEMLLGRFTNRILNKDALKENNICFRRQKVEIPAGLIGGVINHPRLPPPPTWICHRTKFFRMRRPKERGSGKG